LEQIKNFHRLVKLFLKKYLRTSSLPLIAILHTFGKDLKFHPHLHLIVGAKISFKSKFNRLWKDEVLKQLNFPAIKSHSYGFYVWNSKEIQKKTLSKYIARYVRHPALANGRIVYYNKKEVTFYYKDDEDKEIYITKPATDFMSSLIQHIPPTNFKMIRHYGTCSRNQKKKDYSFLTSSVE
jgi:hypothetical protein